MTHGQHGRVIDAIGVNRRTVGRSRDGSSLRGSDTEPSQQGPAYTSDSLGVTRRCCTGTTPEQMFAWRVG
jgi:hypothetical protein